jgi:hypothetical protein
MGHNEHGSSRWVGPILAVAVAGMAFFSLPSVAQHVSGSSGHISSGHMTATRSMAPSRSMGTGSQRSGAIRANSLGAGSARNMMPPWATPSPLHTRPNYRRDSRSYRRRGVYGVGYVGLPYYGYPSAFVDGDGDDDQGDDTAQQAQPDAPNGPENGPEGPYAEGPPSPYEGPPHPYSDQGYPPPRAPYSPEQQQQNSAADQSDGLDHPALTLVFNDGRPPVQVHSYVLTGSSVFVAENGQQRVIPVTDLNLPATIAQNREAGVDFELPGGSR